MELDRLEVVFDGDLTPFEEKLNQFTGKIDQVLGRIQQSTSRSAGTVEKNLSSEKGFDKFTQQFEKLNQNLEKTFSKMEQITKENSSKFGHSMASGVTKGAARMTKDVQTALDQVNLKMQQAQVAQKKLANLQASKNGATLNNDGKASAKIEEQIARVQIAMNRSQSEAQHVVRSLRREYEAIPNALSSIASKMDLNEAQIEKMRAKVKLLNRELKSQMQPVGDFESGSWKETGMKDTAASLKTAAVIEKQSAKMQKMIAESDQMQRTYAELEAHAHALQSALNSVNTELSDVSGKSKMASNGMNNLSKSGKKVEGVFKRLKSLTSGFTGLFKRQTKVVSKGSNQMSGAVGHFGRRLGNIAKQALIFSVMYRGIRLLSRGLMFAFRTNNQFAASLNQIKVNLLTAFYPIYTAILPAINAFMRALEKATSYLASFITIIFGTTFAAAKKGAEGLRESIDALEGVGSVADQTKEKVKKLQRSLMGFDELNTLNLQTDDEDVDSNVGAGGLDWSGAEPETPQWLTNFADKLKVVMSKLFDPIKKAWDKQGKKVIDAWKYALKEVAGLIQAIGQSFMKVWTNGTGQRVVEQLLILFADILNIIGDITGAFKRAWEDGGRGTAVIQAIFDMWHDILALLHSIADAFRNAWHHNRLGESIAANILDIVMHIHNVVGNLAKQFKKAWEQGRQGESIFKTMLSILNGLLSMLNRMAEATADWAKSLDFTQLLKAIDRLLKAIEPLTKNIGTGLEWFYKNVLLPLANYTIESGIPAFLEMLAGAIDFLNGIIEGCKPAIQFLWDNILKPFAEWTGGVIVDVLKGIGEALSSIGQWISEHAEGFSNFVLVLGTFALTLKVISALSGVGTILSSVFGLLSSIGGLSGILSLVGTALSTIVTLLGGPIVVAFAAAVAAFVFAYKNCEPFREFINNLLADIKKFSDKIYNEYIKPAMDDVVGAFQEAMDHILTFWNQYGEQFFQACQNVLGVIWRFISPWLDTLWKQFKSVFETVTNLVKIAWDLIKGIFSGAFKIIGGLIKVFTGIFTGDFDLALKGVKDIFAGTWEIVTSGFEAFVGGLATIAKGIGNVLIRPIESAVNGVIGGVNWVLGAVNVDWRLTPWQAPYFYANGTGYHPGGLAVVNDGLGSSWQEMFKLPNGQIGAFPKQRNLLVDLPRGTQVLPGSLSASLLPNYAGGIFSTFKDFFKNGFDKAKGIATNVWEVVSNPSALVDLAMDKFANVAGMLEPVLSIAKGVISTAKQAVTNWVVDTINQFTGFSNGGLVDHFGLYQLAEGNAPEMVIPLTKPQLALQRMDEALDFMGFDLTLPEIFKEADPGAGFSGHKRRHTYTNDFDEHTNIDKLVQAIISALQANQATLENDIKTLNLTVEVGGNAIGQAAVDFVNEQIEKTNQIPFNF